MWQSRTIGLKHYGLAFGTSHEFPFGIKITTPPRIFVNCEVDFLCPMHVEHFEYCGSFESLFTNPKIQNLALNIVDYPNEHPNAMLKMSLRELHLYHHPIFEHKQLPIYRRDGFRVGFIDLDESRVTVYSQRQVEKLRTFSDNVKRVCRHLEARQRILDNYVRLNGGMVPEDDRKFKKEVLSVMLPRPDIKLRQLMVNRKPMNSDI
jgi:hypothetical protein